MLPVIVTVVPVGPRFGVKLVMVGSKANTLALVAVWPATVTLIGPVVTPEGAVATNFVAAADVTVAAMPLNLTLSLAAVESNPVP